MKIAEIIKNKLASLNPSFLEVNDDSSKHAGHYEGESDESHFSVVVVSEKFEGLPLVKRHKLVYEILNDEIKNRIHAFALKTLTPTEYK